jgi:hypothetical protein
MIVAADLRVGADGAMGGRGGPPPRIVVIAALSVLV